MSSKTNEIDVLEPINTFGLFVRNIRKKSQINLVDFSRIIGVSVSYLSSVERGLRDPFGENVISKIASFHCRDSILTYENVFASLMSLARRSKSSISLKPSTIGQEMFSLIRKMVDLQEDGFLDSEQVKEIDRLVNSFLK